MLLDGRHNGDNFVSKLTDMKRSILIALAAVLVSLTGTAQIKQDTAAIKKLCGCFEVEFKYAETFSPDIAYQLSKPYYADAIEWVVAEESSDKKLVLQHLLVVQDDAIVKHWREDWEFEKKEWWIFDHDGAWKKKTAKEPVKGEWTQTVWETEDAPRYQGNSKWISNNGKLYWENTADAPLPRREYTKRSDYNVLERGNTIIIDKNGWTHEQDNRKIKRVAGTADKLIAEEKGYNIYRKTDEAKCKAAKDWWEKNHAFWNNVRAEWDAMLQNKTTIQLVPKVDNQTLSQAMAAVQKQGLADTAQREIIRTVLNKYTR